MSAKALVFLARSDYGCVAQGTNARLITESDSIVVPAAVAQFGHYILSNQERVTRRWVTLIDRSAEVPGSEDLTYRQVLDHLPALCRELGAVLKRPNVPAIRAQATRDASAHGSMRWEQGYDLVELIREIYLLRDDVLEVWLRAFGNENPDFDPLAQAVARTLVRRFFDNVVIDSTAQFAEEQAEAVKSARAAGPGADAGTRAAKTELVRDLSHNLREPLAAIGLASDALQLQPELSEEAREYVEIISRNVKREADYVSELLAAAQA